ncbi:PDR/VanB family oxidoreductase [Aquariibacter albus]|uniref:Oxidoreductase n=1 Tax=Aquariibacter albus TaxID=2759899 RepID=A0A839HUI3_9BURK|nr:PDR/VanB family oxidoreductase [Aquariibacter albus]MBB1163231.1 oxidoreductase [Aquariibacter albus]
MSLQHPVPPRPAAPEPQGWIAVRVAHRESLGADIVGLQLVAEGDVPLPPAEAGAHIELALPNGLRRCYSLCNPPGPVTAYALGVLRDAASRGGSRCVHAELLPGTGLWIRPPRNLFPLPAQGPVCLLAGGIGITPLLAMAEQLHAEGRDFRLHYACRSRARAAFLPQLAAAPWAARVQLHFDDGPPAQRLSLDAVLGPFDGARHLMVCGPAGLIDAALARAAALGWPEAHRHAERFAAAPAAAERAAEGGFEVVLARSGRVVPVPAGRSVAACLIAAGVPLPLSCEQGICGTCAVRVLDGEPDHRDLVFTAAEQAANTHFTPCCSRAKSARLVLDL